MIEITEKEWEANQKEFSTKVEEGQDFLVRKEDGSAFIATDVTKFEQFEPLHDT
tara:strand:+ start:3128 stop:3289 length:162 start_codon:yes stop_codon:yes gene_type:complete